MHEWVVALMEWPINSEYLEASSVRSKIDQRGNFQSREYHNVGSLVQQGLDAPAGIMLSCINPSKTGNLFYSLPKSLINRQNDMSTLV